MKYCRSEEHTSELQSRLHLVCRLLLEKKKHRVADGGPRWKWRFCHGHEHRELLCGERCGRFFFLIIRRPPRSTLFPLHDALPISPREYIVLAEADDQGDGDAAWHRGKVLPVYPATEGLSHKIIRALIDRHLDGLVALG